jgi:thiol-disulfide isomerase/thioredoxin
MFRRTGVLALALILALPTIAGAQAPPAPVPAASEFSKAVTRAADRLAAAKAFSVEAVEDWESNGGPDAQKGTTRYRMAVARPDRFAIRAWPGVEKDPSIEVGSDGASLTTMVRGTSPMHAVGKPRDAAESVRRNPLLVAGLAGSFLATLIRPDVADFVNDSVSNVTDLGLVEPVGGAPSRWFRGVWSDGRTVEFWLTEGDAPLLAKVRLTRVVPPVKPTDPTFTLTQTTRYSWTFGPVADGEFLVSPPRESKAVDDLYAAVTGAGETLSPGRKAPALDLEILGGGRLNLSEHEGREPVVLNFWARWYPIGLESLPTIAEFAKEYAPKGVAFYQINLAEPHAVVERTLEALKLRLVVALDPMGLSMERYAVRALPFSVLIGKDGTIQAVNAGDLRGFKDRFRKQLDALATGSPQP